MAQLAIPLIALGGFYIISNHNKNADEENEETIEKFTNKESNIPVNYPIVNNKSLTDNVNNYPNANQSTDKYFDYNITKKVLENNPEESVGSNKKVHMSLTGEPIDNNNFEHNNMAPFFGSKTNGASVSSDIAETRLDNMQGAGSQITKKQEQAPLFKPQNNMQHSHGMPNMNDFLQSRVNPSMKMANIKPWEEERVAPGLGKGSSKESGNGFNSGMEAREMWGPKNVDELRTKNNPKESFALNGHQGPASFLNKSSGNRLTQGKVEKYTPDTYYALGPERLMTTTGIEKAPTARGIELLPDGNRNETTAEYYGVKANGEQSIYRKSEYRPSTKIQLASTGITNATAKGQFNANPNNYGVSGYKPLPTNRSSTKQPDEFRPIGGAVTAVIAPLLDVLRPSRKENVIGNLRINGNAGTTVSNAKVFNPADRTKTTIREMTENLAEGKYLNVQNQGSDAYIVSQQQPVTVQRDTTSLEYLGNAGPSSYKANQTYNSAYGQRNNNKKTHQSHTNQGNMQMFNNTENISVKRYDNDRNNNRMFVPSNGPNILPSKETHGKIGGTQYYDNSLYSQRINEDILSAFKKNPYTQSLQSVA
tara:strand:- start:563 stop:2341 length:1779 start_codon:yes stop_codon:yes gene_type:complete